MAFTGLDVFDRAVHRANAWIKDLHLVLGWDDRHHVYGAFVAVLRALRDRLPHAEAVQLGAQLPMLLAGAYYAGWRLSTTPLPLRDRASFLERVSEELSPGLPGADAEAVTRAVFDVLAGKVSGGELEDVVSALPPEIRELWAVPLPAGARGSAVEGRPEGPPSRPGVLDDWNVVVTLRQGGYGEGLELLSGLGEVGRTSYGNVLALRVDDTGSFLESLGERREDEPDRTDAILGRVIPVEASFRFQSVEEFETKARRILVGRLDELAGRSFHVRVHRHGFKGRLSSREEERFLGDQILDELTDRDETATVSFDRPDVLVVVETVSTRAGVSLLEREELDRFPFLGPE